MITRLRWLFLFCAITAVACERITDPALSAVTERFNPPLVYQKWWTQTEACSGLKGSFSSVDWYHTPEQTINIDGEKASAYWSKGSNRIVLTQNAELDGQVVRHEMLHALLKGKGEHPREQFLGKCRGVVHCENACVPSQLPNSQFPLGRRVSPDSMTVSVTVDPASPSMAIDGGFFQVIVEVRNVRSELVVVNIPAPFLGFSPVAFTGSVTGPSAREAVRFADDYSSVSFEPGETKREIFDFSLTATPQQPKLVPGQYRIFGKYGSVTKGPIFVTVPST